MRPVLDLSLYVVTDPAAPRGPEAVALAAARGGARVVQLRDKTASDAEFLALARRLARRAGAVVAVTGAVDYVPDGTRAFRVAGGHPLMPRITVMGCSLTGVVGAFLAGEGDPLEAAACALAAYAVAGERAGARATGPGSFQVAFLDALAALTPEALDAEARIAEA